MISMWINSRTCLLRNKFWAHLKLCRHQGLKISLQFTNPVWDSLIVIKACKMNICSSNLIINSSKTLAPTAHLNLCLANMISTILIQFLSSPNSTITQAKPSDSDFKNLNLFLEPLIPPTESTFSLHRTLKCTTTPKEDPMASRNPTTLKEITTKGSTNSLQDSEILSPLNSRRCPCINQAVTSSIKRKVSSSRCNSTLTHLSIRCSHSHNNFGLWLKNWMKMTSRVPLQWEISARYFMHRTSESPICLMTLISTILTPRMTMKMRTTLLPSNAWRKWWRSGQPRNEHYVI